MIRLSDLRSMRHRLNPKRHDLASIVESIRRFGFTIPVGIDVDRGVVVAGHGRIEALTIIRDAGPGDSDRPWPPSNVQVDSDGEWLVPAMNLHFDSEQDRDEYLHVDNDLTIAGGWDDDKRRELLAGFGAKHIPIGMTVRAYNKLMAGFRVREPREESAPTSPIPSRAQLGDVWHLGRHRVACCDCTDPVSIAALVGDAHPSVVITSPPYNAGSNSSVNGAKKQKYVGGGDSRPGDEYLALLVESTRTALEHADVAFVNLQMIGANKVQVIEFLHAMRDRLVDVIIWDKERAAPAAPESVMNSQFEFVLIFAREVGPSRAIPGADFRGTVSNVVKLPPQVRNEYAAIHGATFPIALPLWILKSFDARRGGVIDPFLGTGTTLIACEQTGRTCYGAELDPGYVDVVLDRWERHTGHTATVVR